MFDRLCCVDDDLCDWTHTVIARNIGYGARGELSLLRQKTRKNLRILWLLQRTLRRLDTDKLHRWIVLKRGAYELA